jgi:hypothetical protein
MCDLASRFVTILSKDDVSRSEEWQHITSQIREKAEFNGICHDIPKDYVEYSIKHADFLLAIHQLENGTNIMKGFILANKFKTVIKIKILCSNPTFGASMLTHLKGYAFNNKIRLLTLSSLTNVLLFYRKLGFENSKSTHEEPILTEMAKSFENRTFADLNALLDDTSYKHFLSTLVTMKLTDIPNVANEFCMVYHVSKYPDEIQNISPNNYTTRCNTQVDLNINFPASYSKKLSRTRTRPRSKEVVISCTKNKYDAGFRCVEQRSSVNRGGKQNIRNSFAFAFALANGTPLSHLVMPSDLCNNQPQLLQLQLQESSWLKMPADLCGARY